MPTPPPPAPTRKPRPARPTLEVLTAKEFMHPFTNATLAAPDALMTALACPLKLQRVTDINVFRALFFCFNFGLVSIPQKCDNACCKGKQTFEEQYRQADPSHHHPNASARYQVRSCIGTSRASGWFLGFLEGSGGLNKPLGHHWEVIRSHGQSMKKVLGGGWKSLGGHKRNWQVIRSHLEIMRNHSAIPISHLPVIWTP